MLYLLEKAMKGGARTSEFWLSVLAIVLPLADGAARSVTGTAGIVAGALVAAAYSVSRGMVKSKAVEATAQPAASESALNLADDRDAAASHTRPPGGFIRP